MQYGFRVWCNQSRGYMIRVVFDRMNAFEFESPRLQNAVSIRLSENPDSRLKVSLAPQLLVHGRFRGFVAGKRRTAADRLSEDAPPPFHVCLECNCIRRASSDT